ncbi:hypothetical protein PENSPDRAFT_160025 [Peniophora sp. CONT]|nr:hypothetical protein PENSPDRAFT_160025 [Peniophora sp. CONT]
MSTTTTMSGAVGTEQSEDLQSLYNAVLQGFADETPADNASQRTIASPASSRRPLPAPPRVAQSVYDSIPPPPPMPAGNKRYAMPEPAHGYTAPSTTMTSQNGQNGFRRGPSFRPPGAGTVHHGYPAATISSTRQCPHRPRLLHARRPHPQHPPPRTSQTTSNSLNYTPPIITQ